MRKLLFLMVMLMSAMTVFAQDDDLGGIQDKRSNLVQIGVKAGANFTTMSKYKVVDLNQKSGFGYEVGAVMTAHLGKRLGGDAGSGRWAVQIEPTYAYHTIGTDFDDIKLSFFELPILGKYYILPTVNVEAGVNLCGTLSAKPEMLSAQVTNIAIGDIKGFDVRPFIGVSYEVDKKLYASLRYSLGTSDLAGNFPCKLNTLNLTVGYRFDIFKF